MRVFLLLLPLLCLVGGQEGQCREGLECRSQDLCPAFQEEWKRLKTLPKDSTEHKELLELLKGSVCNKERREVCCEPEVDEDLLLFGDGAPVLEAEAPPEEGTQDVLDKTKEVSVSNDWDPADNITTLGPCDYKCNGVTGACEVYYTGTIAGEDPVRGSCFPASFGIGLICEGTPPQCAPCNTILGNNCLREIPIEELCENICLKNGFCSVRYKGPTRNGPKKGTCFSKKFGGKCRGVPEECPDCREACGVQ